MNYEKTIEEIHAEWRRLHHNASIARYWPEMRNEYENHLFNDWLGDHAAHEIEYLQEWIKEDYSETLTFYQYGRQGATIAPSEWMVPAAGGSFGAFDEEKAIGYGGGGLDALNRAREVLKILRLVNKFWRAEAKAIGEAWADTKEANEYDKDIIAHDGKTLKTIEVWR